MRLKNRERTDAAFFDHVFSTGRELYLALHNGEYPYLVPVNYVRIDNKLYIHGALKGTKITLLQQNPCVSFCVATDIVVSQENSTTYYQSVCGTGRASLVEGMNEKRQALDTLARRYAAHCEHPSPDAAVQRVSIIRIDIQEMHGKAAQEAAE